MAGKGTRVRLIHTDDSYTGLEPGDEGTITGWTDSLGTVHVEWDSGSSMGLIPGHDQWEETSISKAKAEEVQAWVRKKYAWFGDPEGPRLYPPGHEGPMWVLSWEGGPDEWALDCTWTAEDAERIGGVFLEPVYSWCLGLYPQRD